MSAQIQPIPAVFGPAYIRPAEVTRTAPNQIHRVRLEGRGEGQEMTASMAMPAIHPLKKGDRVLVAGENPTCGYIIGMLETNQQPAIRTSNGAGAKLEGQGFDQHIAVHDDNGRPLFEYFPADGRCVVKACQGDLQLAAPNGSIDLKAGKSIRCRGAEDVIIAGGNSIRVTSPSKDTQSRQELIVNGEGARLGVHKIDVIAGQSEVSIARATYRGKQLISRVERAKLVYGKLEITARKIWQRSEDLFRQVRHLCQMQAGRMRTLVKGAHHTQSQRTTLIAKEDVRIDGQSINLG